MVGLISIFRSVHDPRDRNARHDLSAILFLALAGTLCGAKSCVEIAEFAEANAEDLAALVPLPHGTPSHDTFSRVFRLLDPAELDAAFRRFMSALRESLGLPAPRGVVAIDAKSLRRGYEQGRSYMPPLMVSVWDSQTRLSIAQARAPGNGEVKATLALLKGLVLKGCTVTADALHGHAAMARAVRQAKAHYCLGIKGNRGPLQGDIEAAFAERGDRAPFQATTEAGHGRREERRASVLPAQDLAEKHGFPALAAIGRIEASRTLPNKRPHHATRHLLLSRKLSPEKLLEVVRLHWSIENHLHWTLDVVFDEDDARSRKNYAPENLAVIRRIALSILNAQPSGRSTVSKMRQARWKKEAFLNLFTHLR